MKLLRSLHPMTTIFKNDNETGNYLNQCNHLTNTSSKYKFITINLKKTITILQGNIFVKKLHFTLPCNAFYYYGYVHDP